MICNIQELIVKKEINENLVAFESMSMIHNEFLSKKVIFTEKKIQFKSWFIFFDWNMSKFW